MGRSTKARRRLMLGAVAFAAVTGIGARIRRRRPVVERVASDLRSPVLYLPFDLRSERTLRAVRSLNERAVTPVAAGVDVSERMIGGSAGEPAVRVVLYEPSEHDGPRAALLWIHGGGMVMGRPEQANQWCSEVAAELGILVVSVDYRLAPEHPFPAGVHDCYGALEWLHADADALDVDVERIAVGGDSAGGGLSASLCQLARDRGGPAVCFQLLNYPMLDDRSVLRADHQGRGELVWTPASNRFGWSAYLGSAPSAEAAPMHAAPARTTDLAGLPPAWIGVGDLDLFFAEDVDYAERLEAAGVPCELHVEAGMYHGADQLLRQAPRMRAYRQRMVDALKDAVT